MSSEQEAVNSGQETVSREGELEKLKEVNQQQAVEVERLKKEVEELKTSQNPQDSSQKSQGSVKTQGVKPSRGDGMGELDKAAKRASQSNSRSDVAEYMRLRRGYV